ncbi:hypothetical protein FCL54_04250 [Pseudalkalibacillus caeni]|uniref:L-ribulose-5-phosphate 4-epimerase n=1 Tax=Exobacillus caeni TaxID=2574798 RepID=A0A5R9FAN2_9BACL|nr:hypothetical protein FCL54_04250 [Pseudalkalibacillus caeni]
MKPSGMPYSEMKPEDMLVLTDDGKVIEGEHTPSVDTAAHLYIYKQRPEIRGIVHTHSNYATSFAALGQEIPPIVTSVSDMF